MRQSRNAQTSISDCYSKHEHAQQLRKISELLDEHPIIPTLIKKDFDSGQVMNGGPRAESGEYSALLVTQADSTSQLPAVSFPLVRFTQLSNLHSIMRWAITQQIRLAKHDSTNPT